MFDVRVDMVKMKTKLEPKYFPLSMRPAWLCAQRIVSHRIGGSNRINPKQNNEETCYMTADISINLHSKESRSDGPL